MGLLNEERCQWCGSTNLNFIETKNSVHYGKYVCIDCNRWVRWVSNPETIGRTRTSRYDINQVNKHHNFNGKPFCFFCLRYKEELGAKETLTLDHIKELDKGGEDVFENLQILCSACHKLKNWARLYINWHFKED